VFPDDLAGAIQLVDAPALMTCHQDVVVGQAHRCLHLRCIHFEDGFSAGVVFYHLVALELGDENATVRQQIDAGREFRGRVDAFWEACEQWADTQLEEVSTSLEEDKKNSNRISKPKSPRKSKPS